MLSNSSPGIDPELQLKSPLWTPLGFQPRCAVTFLVKGLQWWPQPAEGRGRCWGRWHIIRSMPCLLPPPASASMCLHVSLSLSHPGCAQSPCAGGLESSCERTCKHVFPVLLLRRCPLLASVLSFKDSDKMCEGYLGTHYQCDMCNFFLLLLYLPLRQQYTLPHPHTHAHTGRHAHLYCLPLPESWQVLWLGVLALAPHSSPPTFPRPAPWPSFPNSIPVLPTNSNTPHLTAPDLAPAP